MMEHLAAALDWIGDHAAWAGPVVFLIALAESLAVVGLIVPGALLMFGTGALIGSGRLEYWPIVSWAVAGAVAGDGLSYLLGRWLGPRLAAAWPFRRRPELLRRAVHFFHRHGAKSVLLGRFVGPLRPIIPAVAGMLHMPAGRFLVANVLSAVFWAPAYLLPGLVLVASLTLVAAVAGRLVVLGLAVVAAGWLLVAGSLRLLRALGLLRPAAQRVLWLSLALSLPLVGLAAGLALRPLPEQPTPLSWVRWQQHGWELAPQRREGVWGAQEPFPLQLAAYPVEIARALVQSGWQLPEPFDLRGALLWLSPEVDLVRVPPLPQRRAGQPPAMTYVRYYDDDDGSRLVLRIWQSGLLLRSSGRPVWLVAVEREALTPGWPWLRRRQLDVPGHALTELKSALRRQLPAGHDLQSPAGEQENSAASRSTAAASDAPAPGAASGR